MLDVPLVLQNPQQGADGGVTGSVGEGGQDFGGAGPPPLVEQIHDLAFAAAKVHFIAHNSANILALPLPPSTAIC